MSAASDNALRAELEKKKQELTARLERISANLRRGYEADSKERAKQLEDNEVVDALGNEARLEIAKISAALRRIDTGDFGLCTECGTAIEEGRIKAYPYANECIECAEFDEKRRARP
ncbi:MAG: TraR/DksA family transcriptional regulator [Woeseiaceae bacterium]